MSVTDAPQMIAAPHDTSTPTFPREARWGLDEFAPNPPHTIAEMINARTERMRPTVMTAPTMMRNCSIPGSPVPFGSISIKGVLLLLTSRNSADLPDRCACVSFQLGEMSQEPGILG